MSHRGAVLIRVSAGDPNLHVTGLCVYRQAGRPEPAVKLMSNQPPNQPQGSSQHQSQSQVVVLAFLVTNWIRNWRSPLLDFSFNMERWSESAHLQSTFFTDQLGE